MFCEGKVLDESGQPVKLDAAIFADTGDEPIAVYRHIRELKKRAKKARIKLLIRTKGKISTDLLKGQNSTGQRFASIPAYTLVEGQVQNVRDVEAAQAEDQQLTLDERDAESEELDQEEPESTVGRTRRQCSKEYKIEVIERAIREELIGVKRGERVPKDVIVHQYIGISLDESGRSLRIRQNTKKKWVRVHFPLIEQFFFTRPICKEFLALRYSYEIPRSACVYCPFHDDNEWLAIKAVPEDWALAVKVDEGLRTSGAVANRKMDSPMFVHRSCLPLVQIEFKANDDERAKQLPMNFNRECMGVCGV